MVQHLLQHIHARLLHRIPEEQRIRRVYGLESLPRLLHQALQLALPDSDSLVLVGFKIDAPEFNLDRFGLVDEYG
jgi:hypothetical protein